MKTPRTTTMIMGGVMSVATLLSLNSCQSNDTQEMSQVAKTYTAFHNAQENAIEKSIKVLDAYHLTNDSNTTTRNIQELRTVEEVFASLPADPSKLKRSTHALTRTLGNQNISEVLGEVTLEEELNKIAEAYITEVLAMAPNPADALTLPNVQEVNGSKTGELIVDGEFIISPLNAQGATTIEFLNAVARGENTDAILAELDRLDAEDNATVMIEEDNASIRGMRSVYHTLWDGGNIYYNFSNINAVHKEEVLEAMRDWEAKTDHAIAFKDIHDQSWYVSFLAKVHTLGTVTIQTKSLSDAKGSATPGFVPGFSNMYIDTYESNRTHSLHRTTRHELGHVIGLMHEHQREDRDEWIQIPSSIDKDSLFSAYKKFDEFITLTWYSLHWKHVCTKKWGVRYCYWSPYWNTEKLNIRQTYQYGAYDCSSIMHYHNQGDLWRTKSRTCGTYKPWTKIDNNYEITNTDTLSVKTMY